MWEKVVLNLISNAFKFTFEGDIGIAAKPSSDGRYAEVTVRDTGTGVERQGHNRSARSTREHRCWSRP
jgi:signal transduction histidine kinase